MMLHRRELMQYSFDCRTSACDGVGLLRCRQPAAHRHPDSFAAAAGLAAASDAWIEMKTTIKHIFVHGHDIKTISRDTLNQNFPGLATKVTKILRSDEDTDICAAWKKVPATVRQVLLESGGSHPLYDTMTALADDFDDAFSTSTSVKKHIQEDCSTDFTMTC